MNETTYCEPADGVAFNSDTWKNFLGDTMEDMLGKRPKSSFLTTLAAKVTGNKPVPKIRRKWSLGLVFGDRAALSGFDLKFRFVEVGIPDIWRPSNFNDPNYSMGDDFSFKIDFINSSNGIELSSSRALFVSPW